MPKRYCAIQNCKHNKGATDSGVRMFRLTATRVLFDFMVSYYCIVFFDRCPKEENSKKQWINAINLFFLSFGFVCDQHFVLNDFHSMNKLSSLKKDAVPSVFLSCNDFLDNPAENASIVNESLTEFSYPNQQQSFICGNCDQLKLDFSSTKNELIAKNLSSEIELIKKEEQIKKLSTENSKQANEIKELKKAMTAANTNIKDLERQMQQVQQNLELFTSDATNDTEKVIILNNILSRHSINYFNFPRH